MGPDDGAADDPDFRPPPPPDDRIWRHPSEVGTGQVEHPSGVRLVRTAPPMPVGPTLRVALIAALGGSLLTWAIVAITGGIGERVVEVIEREAVPGLRAANRTLPNDVVQIAEDVRPAITRIEVVQMGGSGSGSGVLFRDNGYLLTNHHVVGDADQIVVITSDGREYDGELVGGDPETDIAVVKIAGDKPFPVAVLGTATELRVGQPAIAIGSPLGLRGGPSVTVGVISALGRRVDSAVGPSLLDMIQTDAPIAPGSSGGALLDTSGAVVGVTTAIAVSEVGAEGLGFATPIDVARAVAEDLINDGNVRRVWMGIEGIDLAAGEADELGVDGGALVENVFDDSPASAAGLANGDVIVQIDDERVSSMSELVVVLRTYEPGARVTLEVLRDGELISREVVLGERPEDL
jgi:S1-C subfamily serine protease